jgi:hypothetical protein
MMVAKKQKLSLRFVGTQGQVVCQSAFCYLGYPNYHFLTFLHLPSFTGLISPSLDFVNV